MDFLELVERGYTGPVMEKDDWDVDCVVDTVQDLLEEYGLSYPAGAVLETDEDTLRRYYAAGRELAIRIGVYNQDTKRVIRFTPEEIDEAAARQHKELTVGRGKDAFTFYARRPEDVRRPGVVAGNPGCPMDEAIFQKTVESWAKEPGVDMVTCGSIVEVEGHKVSLGSPAEVFAVRRELKYLNEVCDRLGRGGIGRLAAESSVSQVGDLSAMGFNGFREGDAHLVALNNEMIVTNDNLIRAASSVDTPVLNASLACVMVGGMAGNAAGAAVCMIASMLAANVLYLADYHLCHPIHIRHVATGTPECMYLQSAVCGAFALCAPCVVICDIYPKSGAGTRELLREVAANALAITVSGGHLEGVGSCDGLKPNCSGLEARMMAAVGRAAAEQRVTRADAERMIRGLLKGYGYVFGSGNEGLPFDEVYDAEKMEPLPFWQAMYDDVAAELAGLGLKV